MLGPCVSPVQQGSAGHRRPVRRVVLATPGVAGGQPVVEKLTGAAGVESAALEFGDLGLESFRPDPVVVVEVCDELPSGELTAEVALRAERGARVEPDVADPVVGRDEIRDAVLPVI